jgi:ATP synthase protein I
LFPSATKVTLAIDNPNRPAPQNAGQRASAQARGISLVFDLTGSLVGGTLAGGFVGWLIDRWLHDGFIFTLILGAVGFAFGVYTVTRSLRQSGGRGGSASQ